MYTREAGNVFVLGYSMNNNKDTNNDEITPTN